MAFPRSIPRSALPLLLPLTFLTLAASACADGALSVTPLDSSAAWRTTAAALTATVVLDKLDSPRGITFSPDGALYVVEAGNLSVNGPCAPTMRGQSCFSGTGGVTRLQGGTRTRIASGLPSHADPATAEISGPQDIAFAGRDNAYVTLGLGGDPVFRSGLGSGAAAMGSIIRLSLSGEWRVIADIVALEEARNPAGGAVDSNPFGLLAEPSQLLVADAGGNSLISVDASRTTDVVTTFPSTPAPPPFNVSEAVPTEVERGPDGALYVSTLTGAPFVAGTAGVYRLDAAGNATMFAGGFKMVVDFAFDRRGGLYVLEYDTAPIFFGGHGRLTLVRRDGTRVVLSRTLTSPTSVAVGPDGAVYVSNFGNRASVGLVRTLVTARLGEIAEGS